MATESVWLVGLSTPAGWTATTQNGDRGDTMKMSGDLVEHLAAVPALVSTAPSWNSNLAVAVLALIVVAVYFRIGCEIADEARGE